MRRSFSVSAIAVVLGLAACSPQATDNAQTSQPAVVAEKDAAPKWLMVAQTGGDGGGIFVDPASRRPGPAEGLSEVTLKVVRGDPRVIDPTVSMDTGLYREELTTFRFNCEKQTYVILKREAVNQLGKVIDTTVPVKDPAAVADSEYQPVAAGGVASVAVQQACPPKR